MRIFLTDRHEIVEVTLRLYDGEGASYGKDNSFDDLAEDLPGTYPVKNRKDLGCACEMTVDEFYSTIDWWKEEVRAYNAGEPSWFDGDEWEPDDHSGCEWDFNWETVETVPYEVYQTGDFDGHKDGETLAFCDTEEEAKAKALELWEQTADLLEEEGPDWGGYSIIGPNGEEIIW